MRKPHILVFDSGVGGLSIVGHIRQTIPESRITYLADTAMFPYGLLAEQALISRVTELLQAAARQLKPDIIVIGCNTASTLVLEVLRKQLAIPVVGVVPAIKPGAEASVTHVVGLLATPGTIGREYTDDLITDYAGHCQVIRVGSSELVQAIEDKMRGFPITDELCSEVIRPFREHPLWPKLDTVVLACTHFPLAIEELSQSAPEIKHWVDSGAAIARRVKALVGNPQPATADPVYPDIALFTDMSKHTAELDHQLLRYGFSASRQWPPA